MNLAAPDIRDATPHRPALIEISENSCLRRAVRTRPQALYGARL